MEKKCAHCKETKSVALFNKGRKEDYTANCSDCCLFFKNKAVADRIEFKKRQNAHVDTWTKICSRCRKTKLLSEFNNGRGSDHSSNCSTCCSEMQVHISKYSKTSKGKATRALHQKTEKRKISKSRHKTTELYAKTKAAYVPRKKELRAIEYERIHSDPGLNLAHGIGAKIGQMLKGLRDESKTVMSYTEFSSRDDMMAHLKSTFDTGMSFSNFGKHLVDGPPVWNVGHRIARFHYDANNPEDVRRCWMKQNLFAQWAKENIQAKVKFPEEAELMQLKSGWPTAWKDKLPSKEERVQMERAVFDMCGKYEGCGKRARK